MAVNRGKQFEDNFKKCWEELSNSTIDRVHDQTSGFMGSKNICDFIAYRKPNIFYLELKSIHGNTLPFSNITDNQWDGLLKKSEIDGVIAGVVVWFVDKDITVFYPIEFLNIKKSIGGKSVKFDCVGGYEITGSKKRVFFEYDIEKFLDEVQGEYE